MRLQMFSFKTVKIFGFEFQHIAYAQSAVKADRNKKIISVFLLIKIVVFKFPKLFL